MRILCDALWVTPNWMLNGVVGAEAVDSDELEMLRLLGRMIRKGSGGTKGLDDEFEDRAEAIEVEKRQRWMNEARKPPTKA